MVHACYDCLESQIYVSERIRAFYESRKVRSCFYQKNLTTDYGHTKAKSLILSGPNSNKYLGCGYKSLVFIEIIIE